MESILDEALKIRSGERNADYGDAVENFRRIAEITKAISGHAITPEMCCMVHIATKLSRERHNHKRDNLVDLCGYVDILYRIREHNKEYVLYRDSRGTTWTNKRAIYADDHQEGGAPVDGQ